MVETISQPQELGQLLPINQPLTVLVDVAVPDLSIAQQLKEIATNAAVLNLVDEHELAAMVALLQAGKTLAGY